MNEEGNEGMTDGRKEGEKKMNIESTKERYEDRNKIYLVSQRENYQIFYKFD